MKFMIKATVKRQMANRFIAFSENELASSPPEKPPKRVNGINWKASFNFNCFFLSDILNWKKKKTYWKT
ncbi:hypothetical protein [Peribacillus sp. NPDC058075]|uniref:hypothetical protein n=1 Tax=unclassified Peribacillus TaxID=2675266 RepID=UPI0036DCC2C5